MGKMGQVFNSTSHPSALMRVRMELCLPFTHFLKIGGSLLAWSVLLVLHCLYILGSECAALQIAVGIWLLIDSLLGEISITETCSSATLMSLSDLFKKPTTKALPLTALFCFCIFLVCFLLLNLTVCCLRFVKAFRQWKNIVRMRYLLKILQCYKYLSSVKHMALKTYFEAR